MSISERAATAEDRAIPGHWEGDLLYGNATSQIATLVERQSRFVMLVKVASKDSEAVVDALIRHASKLPREIVDSHLTAADIADSTGAQAVLGAVRKRWPGVKHLFADGAYDRTALMDKAATL